MVYLIEPLGTESIDSPQWLVHDPHLLSMPVEQDCQRDDILGATSRSHGVVLNRPGWTIDWLAGGQEQVVRGPQKASPSVLKTNRCARKRRLAGGIRRPIFTRHTRMYGPARRESREERAAFNTKKTNV